MPVHRVRKGECLASIATKYGFASWRTIYDDDANRSLRERRPNPNLLAAGDEVVIPTRPQLKKRVSSNAAHTFTLRSEPTMVRLRIPDDGEFRYELRTRTLRASGELVGPGTIEHELPLDDATAELTIWPKQYELPEHAGHDATIWTLAIGELPPAEEPRGVQARLKNLGYFDGQLDGKPSDELQRALIEFQSDNDLVETGAADDRTRRALVSRCGC